MRALLFVTALALFPLSVQAENLRLICQYSGKFSSISDPTGAIPREIDIDQVKLKVSWDGLVGGVAANMTDTQITFSHNGYQYSISRTTGVIRFHNPTKMKDWAEYRRKMTMYDMKAGASVAEAHANVDERLSREISAHEHTGSCDRATAPKF